MSASRSNRLSLGIVSACALAFEITLTRLLAVQQFYHFAFVVVSLAVMGFAASGLLLTMRSKIPSPHSLAVLFSIGVLISYGTMNMLPFDSFSIAWDRRQLAILAIYFVTASLPFVFAGWLIGAALALERARPHRPYAVSLAGSAAGCLMALAALEIVGGEGVIFLIVALGLVAAALSAPARWPRLLWGALAIGSAWFAVNLPDALEMRLSPYKPFEIARLASQARLTWRDWGASARVDVLESEGIHIFPGLSLNAAAGSPDQAALFMDGDGPLPLTKLPPDDPLAVGLAERMPASLAYQLRPSGTALVLQPGAGLDVLLALAAGASQVTMTAEQPGVLEVLQDPYRDFTFDLVYSERVTVFPRPTRAALASLEGEFDIVQFSLSDPFRPITSGAFSLTEHFPLTVEAFEQASSLTGGEGLLVVTRWLGTPPSESAKVWATLIQALGPGLTRDRLIAYRGMRTATMIASARAFTHSELEHVRQFLQRNAFDPVILPDLRAEELNQHNRLPRPVYHQLFSDILDDPQGALAEYEFKLQPATDDRPFFFHYFRWRQTPEVLGQLGRIWQPFGGSGYFVLLALLGLVGLVAAAILAVPVIAGARAPLGTTGFFAALGAGFLLVEIPLIQRMGLLFDHPAVSLAVVLFGVLLFSGLGSHFSERLQLRTALGLLVPIIGLATVAMPALIQAALSWSLAGRASLALLLLAPLSFLMGVPFASGLRLTLGGMTPWAWAVNGAFSGIAGVMAAVIGIDWGFSATLGVGLLCYGMAWLLAPKLDGTSRSVFGAHQRHEAHTP